MIVEAVSNNYVVITSFTLTKKGDKKEKVLEHNFNPIFLFFFKYLFQINLYIQKKTKWQENLFDWLLV